ncbi:unnamed protein product [Phytophthora fragariaefolia]|uniref:Unnamed protein product n=1 Tax=Phytophthora fragariaefolia TaxID=1490495 RepID=A0A9W6Y7L1_9STRA|nr:unnamed protein product [Phytophthora fragariaefolia]
MSFTSPQPSDTGAAGTCSADDSSSTRLQPLHGGVIRELKQRYKVGLFQERLSYLDKSAEDKYRLIQRAGKKPAGTAGVAFGRVPNLLDAMTLLDEAWAATPAALIRSCWIKSHLGINAVFPPTVAVASPEHSDEALVMELCSMVRNTKLVDDMNMLATELRQWLHADADSSERMQHELLYDIQQLLQEEEQQENEQELAKQTEIPQQQPPPCTDSAGVTTNFTTNQSEASELRADDSQPSAESAVDNEAALTEKRKLVEFALQALARAEEALDSVAVREFFGQETTGQALKSVSGELRRLNRIQRGKQSALVAAAVRAAANGDSSDNTRGAISTHEFFYGNGSLRSTP